MPTTTTDEKHVSDVFVCVESHEPNEETIKVLEGIENGRNLLGPYSSLEAMFKDFGINVDSSADHCVQK